MILNNPFISDWEAIRRPKKQLTEKNNQNKNKNCKPHIDKVCKKVLVCEKKANKYEEPYKIHFPITKVCTHGTVTIRQGAVQEHIKIIWIKTYHK